MARTRKPYGAIPSDANNFIRVFRMQLGMSMEELGEKLGTTGQTVQRWETTGKVNVDELPRIAAILGVAPADLVPGGIDLEPDEAQLLEWYRGLSPKDRRSINVLARDLSEREAVDFEARKA